MNELLLRVLDELPLGVWIARAATGEEVYANARFSQILGQDLQGTRAGEYAEPYGLFTREGTPYPESELPFVRALRAGRAVEQDDIVIHRGDDRVFVRACARPLLDDDGKPEHVVVVFSDITREVQNHERARAAERLEAVGRLASGVSHDVNNLLTVIQTTAFLLEQESDAKTRADDLDVIRETTERAHHLTKSLQSFAGGEAGASAPLSVSALVQSLQPLITRIIGDAVALNLELVATREIVGDHAALEQMILNLVTNAKEAMPARGELTLRTSDDGEWTRLEVIDNGSGVPKDISAHVFEPYVSSKVDTPSSGLGLSTAYGIARRHDGDISFKSRPGETRFMVRFPSTERPSAKPAPIPPRSGRASGLVLVADDIEFVRRVTARALERLGFSVVTAANGAEAFAIFEARKDELAAVLLDERMPEVDGREAFMKMHAFAPEVPVVFLTGTLNARAKDELINLGAAGYLPKPIDPRALENELMRVIAQAD